MLNFHKNQENLTSVGKQHTSYNMQKPGVWHRKVFSHKDPMHALLPYKRFEVWHQVSNSDLQCTHYFHTNKHIKRRYEKTMHMYFYSNILRKIDIKI